MKLKILIIILIVQFINAQESAELKLIKDIDNINLQYSKDKEAFTNAVKAKLKELETQHPHFTSLFISNIIKSNDLKSNPALIKHLNDYCNRPKSSCTQKEKTFYASLNK